MPRERRSQDPCHLRTHELRQGLKVLAGDAIDVANAESIHDLWIHVLLQRLEEHGESLQEVAAALLRAEGLRIASWNGAMNSRFSTEAMRGKRSLTITPTTNGPVFEIEIQGSKSRGVSNMQIFCFDMMLTLLSLRRGRSPGFLVHDSHLFDGVEERQIGKALALGAALAEKHGFQHIVSLNTDDIPQEVPVGFNVEDYALDVRLLDSTTDGGLFGFRFE